MAELDDMLAVAQAHLPWLLDQGPGAAADLALVAAALLHAVRRSPPAPQTAPLYLRHLLSTPADHPLAGQVARMIAALEADIASISLARAFDPARMDSTAQDTESLLESVGGNLPHGIRVLQLGLRDLVGRLRMHLAWARMNAANLAVDSLWHRPARQPAPSWRALPNLESLSRAECAEA